MLGRVLREQDPKLARAPRLLGALHTRNPEKRVVLIARGRIVYAIKHSA